MITGFNTDVRHGDVVFHVQTEDKGEGNPCVESLIYVGGQILARKRAGYQALLELDGAAAEVAKLMEQQHRSMISEIRAGKLDAKLAEIKGSSAPQPAAPTLTSTRVEPPPASTQVEPPAPSRTEPPTPAPPRVDSRTVAATPLKVLLGKPPPPAQAPRTTGKPPIASKSATPPPPATPKRSEPAVQETEPDDRSLDQVILDYLEMESEQEKLILSMDRRSGELVAGKEVTVCFRTRSSVGAEPIGNAKVDVRLISTIGEPQVLGQGRTDDGGQLELTLDVPMVKTGSGALIITAESSIGNAEIRHLI